MPVFNHRLRYKTGEGELVPADVCIHRIGLRAPVVISVHGQAVKSMEARGVVAPEPVTGLGLVDTGATFSAIDNQVVKKLGLKPTGQLQTLTAGGMHTAPTYAFSLTVSNITGLHTPRGASLDLHSHGIVALIGMDILSRCLLVLNGPDGSWSLAV